MSAIAPTPDPAAPDLPASGGRLVAADGRELPLREARIRAEACAGTARVVLEQRFHNPFTEAFAAGLGMAVNTFRQNVSRGRRAIAACLARHGIELGDVHR